MWLNSAALWASLAWAQDPAVSEEAPAPPPPAGAPALPAQQEAPPAAAPAPDQDETPLAPAPQGPDLARGIGAFSEAELHQLEGASLYRIGLEHSARGQFGEACQVWLQVQAGYADTAWALRAWSQMEEVAKAAPETSCSSSAAPRRLTSSAPLLVDDGRTELIVTQGVVAPIFLGVFIPGAIGGTDTPLIPVGMAFVGLGAGIGGTMLLTDQHPVTTGQAMSIYAGEVLGGWNGAMLAGALDTNTEAFFGSLAAGTALGGGLGLAVASAMQPTAGEAALARSGATWGLYYTAVSFMIVDTGDDSETFLRLGGGVDLGLAAGFALAGWADRRGYEIDRRRVNLVNLSGYTGAVVGSGVALVVNYYTFLSDSAGGAMMAGGAAVGLGLGAYLTRDGRGPALASADGVLIGHDDSGWTLGAPLPLVVPSKEGYRVTVPLAAGRF